METINKIYSCYRTDKELHSRVVSKYKQLDNIISINLQQNDNHNKEFLIHLLTELIEFCKENEHYDYMENIRSSLSKILRILRITNIGKNGTCVCGAKPVNMTRHLNTKKHKKFIENNPDLTTDVIHSKVDYTPYTYSVRVFKEDTSIPPYSDMVKVQIWDNWASCSWEFGTHDGKIYNRNKIECGLYRFYMDDRVPNEFKTDKGIVMDRFDRPITEYILNEAGRFYSMFSKNIYKAFYYDFKKEKLIRSSDDIMVFN